MRRSLPSRSGRAGLLVGALLATSLALLPATPAHAGNSPTFRDCSLLIGIDPDFVQLYGAQLQNGVLTVPVSAPTVEVQASESSDPGDMSGHVTLHITVAAGGTTVGTFSGARVGSVLLNVALSQPRPGKTYSINWTATFDNGLHPCPGLIDFGNSKANPFVVTIRG